MSKKNRVKILAILIVLCLLTSLGQAEEYQWWHWVLMSTSLSDICNNWLRVYPSIYHDNIHDLDGDNEQGADGIVNFIDFACFAAMYEYGE